MICRQLGDMMGGEVRAESELGKGSTFTLSVPAILAPATAPHGMSIGGHTRR